MNKRLKVFITIFFIGAGYAITYALPFVQHVFADPLAEGLNASYAQLGTLIAIYGIGNVIGAPIGGWLCDKFNHKTIYLLSLVGNGILCFLFAMNMNYKFAIAIWIGLAITGLFAYFPSHVKIVRLLGDEDNQGQVFGLAEAAGGVGSVIVNGIALFLFARAASNVGGIKYVSIGYGVASIVIAAILFFLIDSPEKVTDKKQSDVDKVKASDFIEVLKLPGTWYTGIAIFCVYSLYASLQSFTHYYTNVLGISATIAGGVAIVRTYVIRTFGAPLGGYVGDKIGSVSKAIGIAAAGAILTILAIMILPHSTPISIFIALTLLVSVFTYVGRANMFAVQSEVKIPEKFSATAAGITCAIGFSPDLFQYTLFGNWIDKYGNGGYKYIFIYTMAILAVGIVNAIFSIRYKKKVETQGNN
ncbi:MFS transporter [Tissierella sp.]|uniref:MFS transporter n=1 Tax=Tissierella sp. TaxID=41274 RepID=UPI0028B1E0DA|nr:MFS transporter [Tissierella sp.]